MKKWPKFSIFFSKKNFQDTFFSEKTDLAFLEERLLVGNTKSVFPLKMVSQNFFLLKNMLKIAAFSVLAKNFSGTISRGPLSSWKR